MKRFRSPKVETILANGLSLESIGINNYALDKQQAITALNQLKKINVGIHGGDVYVLNGLSFEPKHDNWFYQKSESENIKDFLVKSHLAAVSYINNYTCSDGEKIFFALVTDT